ncbi:hypothetical protein B0J12DRAFT_453572 [Macrophomina phaseolina]|uniref:Uncharacterized protein n=1 Tax=Macrophomina phaseolina TaxID=35725 RepID=A0ABQ8GFN2_9PEZI|nr:hypothetical protein B0J12DRAFT_453572 [Macrophomina phaseolina]
MSLGSVYTKPLPWVINAGSSATAVALEGCGLRAVSWRTGSWRVGVVDVQRRPRVRSQIAVGSGAMSHRSLRNRRMIRRSWMVDRWAKQQRDRLARQEAAGRGLVGSGRTDRLSWVGDLCEEHSGSSGRTAGRLSSRVGEQELGGKRVWGRSCIEQRAGAHMAATACRPSFWRRHRCNLAALKHRSAGHLAGGRPPSSCARQSDC